MPTTTYVLELTEEELTVIWGVLTVISLNPERRATFQTHLKVDKALESALSKVQNLMEGK